MTIKEFEIQYALGTLTDGVKKELAIKSASKKILSMLSRDGNCDVRYNVADNKSTPKDALSMLSKDKKWEVRGNVARNNNTSIKILEVLSKDKDGWVRDNVVQNPNYKEQ